MRAALATLAILFCLSAVGHAAVDHELYAALLAKYNQSGMVDYAGLKTEHQTLKNYLKSLAAVDPDALPRDEAYAYYVNLYNAATLDLILDNYPVDSIRDIGGFFGSPWKKEFISLKGEKVHLDHIEHDILRPRYQDPRVHFAVNCASIGCPRLQEEPFRGATLDAQLDAAVAEHMGDPRYAYLEGTTLHLNKIFDWFGDDWGSDDDKIAFVKKHAPAEMSARLTKLGDRVKVKYLDYDWKLNEAE